MKDISKKELNKILKEVIIEAQGADIPVPRNIDPEIRINKRPRKRFGACKRENGVFHIEISSFILDCDIAKIRNVIAHEVLHTCRGCDNHGKIWKSYAAIMNAKYGYHIKRTSSFSEMGLPEPEPAEHRIKYVMKCTRCGREYPRERFTCVMKKINAYRCNCGGRLEVYKVN